MIVKPETYKNLVAIKDKKIIKIPNMVLRKIASVKEQDKNLSKNSICIVCNFRFLEEKIEWSDKIKAICHPFKTDTVFPNSIKKYLFSESDFCDDMTTVTNKRIEKWEKLKYDFVYFTLISREGTRSKGAYLLSLINEVSGLLKLKGLIINYATKETSKHKGTIYHKFIKNIKKDLFSFKNLTFVNNKFSCDEVCAIMNSVKFVLLPSDADASPRILVEAIVRNKPLVINSAIYGGWKYISNNNGCFFDAPTIEECFSNKYKIKYDNYKNNLSDAIKKVLLIDVSNDKLKNEFYTNFGFLNSSKKLASIINEISGTKYEAVAFKEWEKNLKRAYKI